MIDPTGIAAQIMNGMTFELDPEPHTHLPIGNEICKEWCRRCGQHVRANIHANFKAAMAERRSRRAAPPAPPEDRERTPCNAHKITGYRADCDYCEREAERLREKNLPASVQSAREPVETFETNSIFTPAVSCERTEPTELPHCRECERKGRLSLRDHLYKNVELMLEAVNVCECHGTGVVVALSTSETPQDTPRTASSLPGTGLPDNVTEVAITDTPWREGLPLQDGGVSDWIVDKNGNAVALVRNSHSRKRIVDAVNGEAKVRRYLNDATDPLHEVLKENEAKVATLRAENERLKADSLDVGGKLLGLAAALDLKESNWDTVKEAIFQLRVDVDAAKVYGHDYERAEALEARLREAKRLMRGNVVFPCWNCGFGFDSDEGENCSECNPIRAFLASERPKETR